MITNRKYNKPSDGYCPILRNLYLDNIPISFESDTLEYPLEYRKELTDEANGSKFSDIPKECPYKLIRLEEI